MKINLNIPLVLKFCIGMIILFIFFDQDFSCAQTITDSTKAAKKNVNALELNDPIQEGINANLESVGSFLKKRNVSNNKNFKIDFELKVLDSVSEMPYFQFLSPVGVKK